MAITNQERIGKAFEQLRDGLRPFVERELKAEHAQLWFEVAKAAATAEAAGLFGSQEEPQWDAGSLLSVIWSQWRQVYRKVLGEAERGLVGELRTAWSEWSRARPFGTDDTYRALDSCARLLTAVSAPQADAVEKLKSELLRVRFDEQMRTEKRRTASAVIESATGGSLRPWREVVSPHKDVASGRYQQAEFAADLWQVHLGEGTDEYRKPVEFFRRTYLTESLRRLLVGAVERISGAGGDPVVQLQTNFGGGKTHSMLALYHLFSGTPPGELAGVDGVMEAAGVAALPTAKRVVLVGNKISPGNPSSKPDGTVVRTLWGELAWQLGGKPAFERVRADDERATSPGDALRELFKEYGPCLILIDEWVAYARQLHDRHGGGDEQGDLPAGSFETQFTFAQALTESAKLVGNCLLVISLPASDTPGSPHTQANDTEVGGQRGREALDRLRNVVGRVESSWRPASAEEGFEIVRRRLFEPLAGTEQFAYRDLTARGFAELYRDRQGEFPPECRSPDYEKRLKAAYPIHPEIFDRLYTDWSTLAKFQRTRGVLRLMAAVIHSLWQNEDKNPLILPASIPIGDARVQFELTRYLSDQWTPILEADVDGPHSLPLRLDGEFGNLGKYSACRRVARTIYLGSAPTPTAANRGLEERWIRLGCAMPGEPLPVFDDALRRMAAAATYLYREGPRYWYSTQPTVTKLAEDRAEQLKPGPDQALSDGVAAEIGRRLREELRQKGDFDKVHPLPTSSGEVLDGLETRLVVLGMDHAFSRDAGDLAGEMARAIFASCGAAVRQNRNGVVFLAADKIRLQDLDAAVRRYLAWESIVGDRETLQLTPHQAKQAAEMRGASDGEVRARLPETYNCLLVPTQTREAEAPVVWQVIALKGGGGLAERASRKLKSDDALLEKYAPSMLRREMDRVPLWRGNHVAIRELVQDFARYLYLPRLRNPGVLVSALQEGVGLLTWEQDSFAYADSFDEGVGRYRGLRVSANIFVMADDPGLLVRPAVARAQMDQEAAARPAAAGAAPPGSPGGDGAVPASAGSATEAGSAAPSEVPRRMRRYHGSVDLDPARVGRDAGAIGAEVVAHLVGLVGSSVRVTLEIEAEIRGGAPENVVRTVTENGRTLKFKSGSGFETE